MAVKFVDNFDVSSESDEEDDYRSPPRKRRRSNRVWIKVQEQMPLSSNSTPSENVCPLDNF